MRKVSDMIYQFTSVNLDVDRFLIRSLARKGQLSRENLCIYANDTNRQRQTLVVTAGI